MSPRPVPAPRPRSSRRGAHSQPPCAPTPLTPTNAPNTPAACFRDAERTGTCGQLLSVTEQLSIAISHLQAKVQNRACVPGMWEDEDTGVCGISGCTNSLYDEFNATATTDSGCDASLAGCCRVLTCVTDGTCKPAGSVQQLSADALDGKPGDCVDDPFHYLEAASAHAIPIKACLNSSGASERLLAFCRQRSVHATSWRCT